MKEDSRVLTSSAGLQVSVSTLTLGTLYEAVLAFSVQDRFETFWPSVCQNARWLIPSQRMGILLNSAGGGYQVVGMFGQGKFHQAADQTEFIPQNERVKRALSRKDAHWITQPRQQFDEGGEFTQWILSDEPDILLVLPMRVKGKSVGALLFAMTSIAESDRAMLNTLGTIYALHVAMAYTLLQISEERRQMQDQLVMQERMAALGNLVAGIAHEMNSPVGVVQGTTDVVARCVKTLEVLANEGGGLEDRDRRERCQKAFKALKESSEVIALASQRIAKTVRSLKSFARLDEAEYARASIQEGIEDTLTLLENEWVGRITVIKDYDDVPKIDCFPAQLNQVFMGLLKNASEAIEGVGTIRIKTRRTGDFVNIQISDSGRGISPERLKRIFNFDFSKKGSTVRMGSGLATACHIIQRHRGEIKAESTLGAGSRFTITLPISAQM
ncbi:MAG: ATP-binding protein [Acidobacteriota bacterium]